MSKQLRILLGCMALALMSANFAANIYSMLAPPKTPEGSDDGILAAWDYRGEPKITNVDPEGPASALKIGDEIIAINGVKFRDDPGVLLDAPPSPPGTIIKFTIRRAGELRDFTIQTVPWKTSPQPKSSRIEWFYLSVVLHLLTAWLILLFRPDDKQAFLLALMLGTMTGLVGLNPSNLPPWLDLIVGLATAIGNQFYPLFVHFFLIFPERSKLLRRWPRLEAWLYLPILLVFAPAMASPRISMGFLMWLGRFQWVEQLVNIAWVVDVVYLAAGLICLAVNYGTVSVNDRRRLRVVMAGSAAGFFTLFLLLIGGVTGLQQLMPTLWSWFYNAFTITFPLIPLSFVYAIVRHKVIPVGLIIRRGMRYLLVSRGSALLLTAIVSVALYFAMDSFFYWKPMTGRSVGIISAIFAIAVWQLARAFHLRVVAPKIDRLFFHQAYDARQIIAELAESLRATTSLPKLLELVATRIQSAMRSSNVAIFLRDESSGDYPCVYYCVYSFHNSGVAPYPYEGGLSRDSALIRRMVESGRLIDIESRDELQSENGDSSELSNEDRELLRKLSSALLLPIMAKGELLGVISVGAHLGDLPYSSDDKSLLLSVSAPASFALENIRLIERTIDDARRRQELEAENEQRARELEGARQLQLSMLPRQLPQLPNLDIEAYMKPATEVGGDYYDFHLDGAGVLTVAVGDATGHGLKAGTVVTAMKSLFRTFAAGPEIVPIFNQSSRVLKEMNLRSLFMGLIMIKLNGRRMKISSAGMPPVLIYRAETAAVEEVMIKAMPLGSVSNYPYRELELTLGCGDVVVLMSDGLPERFNIAGEMFDYSRTIETVAEAASRSPREIIECLVGAGERWANGRPQDDDVTFVVLKMK
jgi:GAF domain-containing protein